MLSPPPKDRFALIGNMRIPMSSKPGKNRIVIAGWDRNCFMSSSAFVIPLLGSFRPENITTMYCGVLPEELPYCALINPPIRRPAGGDRCESSRSYPVVQGGIRNNMQAGELACRNSQRLRVEMAQTRWRRDAMSGKMDHFICANQSILRGDVVYRSS